MITIAAAAAGAIGAAANKNIESTTPVFQIDMTGPIGTIYAIGDGARYSGMSKPSRSMPSTKWVNTQPALLEVVTAGKRRGCNSYVL